MASINTQSTPKKNIHISSIISQMRQSSWHLSNRVALFPRKNRSFLCKLKLVGGFTPPRYPKIRYNGGWSSQASCKSKMHRTGIPYQKGRLWPQLGGIPLVPFGPLAFHENTRRVNSGKTHSLVGPLTEHSNTYAVGRHIWMCLPVCLWALKKRKKRHSVCTGSVNSSKCWPWLAAKKLHQYA